MIDPHQPDYTNTPVSDRRPAFDYTPGERTDQPVVSVITPCLNPGDELDATARCVLGQSLQAIEWVIVDDGSTDEASCARIARIAASDERIRLVELGKNLGPGAARNAGVRAARAGLIFQLDADDLIEPTTLEKCAWHLATHPEHAFVKGYTVAFGAQEHLWPKGFCAGGRFVNENLATISAMIRRSVFLEVGGYDDAIVGGMEDWDFWLRCADAGWWGTTIPEYLDWYRRRPSHADRWADWDQGERQRAFSEQIAQRYPALRAPGGFPRPRPAWRMPLEPMRRTVPIANPLAKSSRRLLMVLPWMRMGGADKFNLDLVEQLTRRGWEVTIATTTGTINRWLPQFARFTPDIFVLPALVPDHDQPVMLRGLIESRRPDVVCVSNSEAAYQYLPYLRSVCPEPAYVDYNHMEEDYWKAGGHPRSGVGAQGLLELNITASHHLKDWMVSRGADAGRVEVATINVDPQQWAPDEEARATLRDRLEIPDDAAVILYAGRICAQKQPRVFARTLALLAARADAAGTPFVAVVAGDGEDRAMLEEQLARDGLTDRVRMLGEVTSDAMRELMAASDIFFLPSKWEGIALVIYEAMAAGAVVVGAIVGGQLELVTPECGVLLPKAQAGRELDDEPGPYAEALAELLADPAQRAAMAQAARARIESSFHLDAMGERMDGLLRRAIELRQLRQEQHRDQPTIDPALGHELGDRAIETMRLLRVADRLWQTNKSLRDQLTRAERTIAAKPPQLPAKPNRTNKARRAKQARIRAELDRIERSRSWRLVRAVRMNPISAAFARVRHGSGWAEHLSSGTPAQRLARIKASRSYRLIERTRRSWLGRLVARPTEPHPAPTAVAAPRVVEPVIEPKAPLNGSPKAGAATRAGDPTLARKA